MTHSHAYTLKEIAKLTGSELIGDSSKEITGVRSLESAAGGDASFLANPLYIKSLKKSKAGAVFITALPDFPLSGNFLIHKNPSQAFQKVIELFHDSSKSDSGFLGIHETAVVHPTAKIGENVTIGPYAVIDQEVIIASGTKIGPHVSIGPYVQIGKNCLIYPHVTIRENCSIGESVILQPGAVIGSCGFGYITDAYGRHNKLTHVGNVVLEDLVEIGANTTIDRGRFSQTRIKQGVKIDNQVQIGHGVEVGDHSLLISQSGVAGSTKLGKYNVLAGQVGVVGHIKTADQVIIAARGAITKSLPQSGRYGGAPALPEEKFYIQQMHFRKLDLYVKKIQELEKKLDTFEKLSQSLESV